MLALLIPAIVKPLMSLGPLIIGIILMIYGVNKIIGARQQQQYVNVSPWSTIIYGVALLIIGFVMAINPFKTVMMVFALFGGVLVVMGILQLFTKKAIELTKQKATDEFIHGFLYSHHNLWLTHNIKKQDPCMRDIVAALVLLFYAMVTRLLNELFCG